MPDVTFLQQIAPGVAQLTLQDRGSGNAFTPELSEGLRAAFAAVRADTQYRVLVLTGYENYFCSGGTREALLALHEGRSTFTDGGLYSLPLECEIPVVAAMQGHALGGGLVFGLSCDFVLLGRESLYTANFMRYGFTPGMGATCILPDRLGSALALEMLLGARSYRGAELEKRGVPYEVLARDAVLSRACQLAVEIAEKPRTPLVALKARLTSEIRNRLPAAIASELAMHERTIHEPNVARLIEARFGH